jgi:hypothetical protein
VRVRTSRAKKGGSFGGGEGKERRRERYNGHERKADFAGTGKCERRVDADADDSLWRGSHGASHHQGIWQIT